MILEEDLEIVSYEQSRMYTYYAYGLGIHSAFLLPELNAGAERKADVVIQPGKLEATLPEAIRQGHSFWIQPREAYLFWNEVGVIRVRNGQEVIVDAISSVDESLLRLQLLGAVLAVLLHQRGLLILHASAVAVGGSVVAFLGDKGQGKSTIAATLFHRGNALVSDDIVPIDAADNDTPTTFSGFPQLKLWPDTIAALGKDPEMLPRLNNSFEKRSHRITNGFAQKRLPLQQIIVLEEGSSLALKKLSSQEAFPQLMKHWYLAPASSQLLQGAETIKHLNQITTLIRQVPVYCLERPRSLDLLSMAAELIENTAFNELALLESNKISSSKKESDDLPDLSRHHY